MADFTGKVILITGSSSGIGAATAMHLAGLGGKVVITGRNRDKLYCVRAECELASQLGPNGVLQVVADVTKDEDLERLIDATIHKFGKLDVLVNNAGAGAFTSIHDPNLMEAFDQNMKLNVRSVVSLTHLAVPYLEQTQGNIVNVSSVAAMKPSAIFSFYSMAKSSIDMFTKCLALELGPKQIRVNSVNPGAVRTNFLEALGFDSEQVNKALENIEVINPLGRVGRPEEVAKAIAYIASDDASFMTGSNLVLDGGSLWCQGIIKEL